MPTRILLVEDQAVLALAEAQTLERHGFDVVTAHRGEKAIEIVGTTPDLDLILMDIDLGEGMDGTQAAERILEMRAIPIVFLTSHTENEYVDRVERISGYGYVLKKIGRASCRERVCHRV